MPIVKSVGAALSRSRLEEVVACKKCTAVVEINPPAPNAMVKIGYDIYYHRISATQSMVMLINKIGGNNNVPFLLELISYSITWVVLYERWVSLTIIFLFHGILF